MPSIEKNKKEIESLKLQIQNNGGFQKCHHLHELEFEFEVEGMLKSTLLELLGEFQKEFTRAHNKYAEAGEKNMLVRLSAGVASTEEKFAAVWNHAELVGYVSSC
jgi:hypothetical protein